MFCMSCGKEIADGATFCPHCGTRIAREQQTPVSAPEPVAEQPAPEPVVEQPAPASEQIAAQPVAPTPAAAPQPARTKPAAQLASVVDYVRLSFAGLAFSVGFGLFMLVPATTLIINNNGNIGMILVSVVLFAVAAFTIWFQVSGWMKSKARLDERTSGPESDAIARDFAQAEAVLDDRLRLGRKYVFGKGSGFILRYDEINQVFQMVSRTNLIETNRELRARVTGEIEAVTLARLKRAGKSDEELKRVLMIMLSHNSRIKVGYR